jgi:hypothetical protein
MIFCICVMSCNASSFILYIWILSFFLKPSKGLVNFAYVFKKQILVSLIPCIFFLFHSLIFVISFLLLILHLVFLILLVHNILMLCCLLEVFLPSWCRQLVLQAPFTAHQFRYIVFPFLFISRNFLNFPFNFLFVTIVVQEHIV